MVLALFTSAEIKSLTAAILNLGNIMKLVAPEIDKYCEEHCSKLDAIFHELRTETFAKTAAPQMQVGFIEGTFLRLLVRLVNAKTILEIGTFTGFSALAMADGLPANGKLITCDVDARATEIAQKYWAQSQNGKKIELRLGPALETISKLNETLDLVFIDADKANYTNYWNAVIPKVRQGGLIVVDNVLWSGRVLKPEDKSDIAIAKFNDEAIQDTRMEMAMLPIRDGMLVAWKK